MVTDSGLLEQGIDVLASLERYISRTEGRLAYREAHARKLSTAHREQLQSLAQRLSDIIDPPPAVAALKAQFDKLSEQLEAI